MREVCGWFMRPCLRRRRFRGCGLSKTFALLAVFLLTDFVSTAKLVEIPEHTKNWQAFKGCEFVPQLYNNGNSFAVKVNGGEFVLRLAFVDAPESDTRFPERNAEQAEHFHVAVAIIPEWGKLAGVKIVELLAKLFTVHTRWATAQGASRKPRFYAVITSADGKDLGEALLALGLARIKGLAMKPPTGESPAAYQVKLGKIETAAHKDRQGIWGKSTEK